MTKTLLLCVAVSWGCAGVRFADRGILWRELDDAPIPMPRPRRNPTINWEGARDSLFRPAERFFWLDYAVEAKNANALDEVPDSTWFTNRRRDPRSPDDQPVWVPLGPDAVERGAAGDDAPQPPFTVLNEKTDGSAHGMMALDARGVKYMLKFDPPEYPSLITSIEVVATRLCWAAGWNVPADTLIEISPGDLQLAPDAYTRDRFDHKLPFTVDDFRALTAPLVHGGLIRAVASRWIEGTSLGWFEYLGRDKHDPNDRFPHEDRRDLRGFGVWAAWVDDVDTFENNTLDTYVGEPGRGHVVHWQQGVGGSFGRFYAKPIEYWMGHETYFSGDRMLASAMTLGLWPRPWQDARLQRARDESLLTSSQLGYFDAEHFDARGWTPIADNAAFVRQTRRDRYWGAKQVVMFTEEEVRAAIRAGRFSPLASQRLFEALWKRREKIARAFFSESSPLDHFRLPGDRLCFEDLWVTAGLGGGARYLASENGRALAVDGECVRLPPRAGYRVVALRSLRPGERHPGPEVRVHLVEGGGARRIVGVER